MSISSTSRKNTYIGADQQGVTQFAVGFHFEANGSLKVTIIRDDGSLDVLVLDASYSVTGAGRISGGNVNLIGFTLTVDETLVIERVIPPTQPTDLTNKGNGFPENIEAMGDRLCEFDQQVEDLLGVYDPNKARVPVLDPLTADGASAYNFRGNRARNADDPQDPQDLVTKSALDTALGALVLGSGGGGFISGFFTVATRPAAGVNWLGKAVYVRDPSKPSVIQVCMETSVDGIYSWENLIAVSS